MPGLLNPPEDIRGLLANTPDRRLERAMRSLLAHDPTAGRHGEGLGLTLGNAVSLAPQLMPGLGAVFDVQSLADEESSALDKVLSGGGLLSEFIPGGAAATGLLGLGVRAAKGLPMDYASRMGRASEQGYRMGLWRGGKTPADGPYYTPDRQAAERFAQRHGPDADVREYALAGRAFNAFSDYAPEDLTEIQKALRARGLTEIAEELQEIPGDYGGKAPGIAIIQILDITTGGNAFNVLRDAGFDVADIGQEIVALSPGAVRDATRAAFDPAKKGKADIYAGLAVPALAGASLLYADEE